MPQKPLDQLSPAYRKRIERGLAKGKTRQQARGKKAGEHIIRKEREIRQHKLTSSQKSAIKKFAEKQAKRTGDSVSDLKQKIITWTERHNYDKFIAVREYQKRQEKNYNGGKRKTARISEGQFEEYIEYEFDIPEPPDVAWFYYH